MGVTYDGLMARNRRWAWFELFYRAKGIDNDKWDSREPLPPEVQEFRTGILAKGSYVDRHGHEHQISSTLLSDNSVYELAMARKRRLDESAGISGSPENIK